MKAFSSLYEALDMTTSTNAKVAAMVTYFSEVSAEDAAWALFFLMGRRLKRLISSRKLRPGLLTFSKLKTGFLKMPISRLETHPRRSPY